MRARLARYARWQARDYVSERGVPTLLVDALILLPIIVQFRRMGGAPPSEIVLPAFRDTMPMVAFSGVLLAINGIVSSDRRHAYYRFLFAKPVRVGAYYAQAFVINGLGLMIVSLIAGLALRVGAGVVLPLGVLGFMALAYLVYGGLGFLLSALVRFDWAALGAMWGLALLLRPMYPVDANPVFGRALDVLLPPTQRMQQVIEAVLLDRPAPHDALGWTLGYAAIAIVLALFVLRHRPLVD